jgi:formylmethanofuran dehydrogenase subunit E
MTAIKEQSDHYILVGEVAWRCHECGKKTERENLHWTDSRLLCVECVSNKGD